MGRTSEKLSRRAQGISTGPLSTYQTLECDISLHPLCGASNYLGFSVPILPAQECYFVRILHAKCSREEDRTAYHEHQSPGKSLISRTCNSTKKNSFTDLSQSLLSPCLSQLCQTFSKPTPLTYSPRDLPPDKVSLFTPSQDRSGTLVWICSCPQSADIPAQFKPKTHLWPLVTILDTSLSWRNLVSLEQILYKKGSLYCSPVPDKVSWNLLTDVDQIRQKLHTHPRSPLTNISRCRQLIERAI